MKETDSILACAGLSVDDLNEQGGKLIQQLAKAKKLQQENPNSEEVQKNSSKIIQKVLEVFKRVVAQIASAKQKTDSVPTHLPKEDNTNQTRQLPENKNHQEVKMAVIKSPSESKSEQEQEPIEVEAEEIPRQNTQGNYQPGPMSDFARKYEDDIAACRERIRAENRRKREIREAEEGPKPKVSRIVRLQRKILEILSVMPPPKKHDQKALQTTEKLLSELLIGLADAWGLKVSRKAEKGVDEKFEDLNQKATKQ